VIGLGLRQLQDALNRKADGIQREFVAISDRLQEIGQKLLEARGEDRNKLRIEQEQLRARQQVIAQDVNLWRDRARAVLQQRGGEALRAYIQQMLGLEDSDIRPAAEQAIFVLGATDEELESLAQSRFDPEAKTPAARLIDRAR